MGRIWDILSLIADRINEVKEEIRTLKEEKRHDCGKGMVSIDGLQRLAADEMPEQCELLMALVGLQVAVEHGNEVDVFHARDHLHSIKRDHKSILQSGKYRIDKDRNTDVAKIISSMYEERIFISEDGFWASNKKAVMQQFGTAFQCNLDDYSTLLSNSKSKSKNYLGIFDKMKQHAQKYLNS